MGEMKIGSTDPKVIATVIIVNHGQSLTHDEVGGYVFEAVGEDAWPENGGRLVTDVWNRIQDADIRVSWDDDDHSAQACGGPCCGGQYEYEYGYEDDEIRDVH